MDKNPKHPLKKKKVVQKVYATANHNAAAAEEPATSIPALSEADFWLCLWLHSGFQSVGLVFPNNTNNFLRK